MDSINNACKFGSDAWLELQAFKTRQLNRREKLNRHKNLQNDLISGTQSNQSNHHQIQNPLAVPSPNNNKQHSASTSSSPPLNSNCALTGIITKTSSNSTEGDEGAIQSNKPASFMNSASSVVSSTKVFSTASIISHSRSTSIEFPNELIDYGLSSAFNSDITASSSIERNHLNLELVECLLLLKLCDVALKLPIDSRSLQCTISKIRGLEATTQSVVKNLLQKFAHQELITIEEPTTGLLSRRKKCIIGASTDNDDVNEDDEPCIYVTSADHTKLVEFDKSIGSLDNIKSLLIESKTDDLNESDFAISIKRNSVPIQNVRHSSTISTNAYINHREQTDSHDLRPDDNNGQHSVKSSYTTYPSTSIIIQNSLSSGSDNGNSLTGSKSHQSGGDDVESLLSLSSTREKESKKLGEELLELLSKPTAKERNLLESFRSADGYQVQEFCPKGTKGECRRNNNGANFCDKLHFKKIIAKHTEESLGDCSFLNTCFHMDSCKYVHYEVDYDDRPSPQQQSNKFKRPTEPTYQNNILHQNHETLTSTNSKQVQSSSSSVISNKPSTTKAEIEISNNKDGNNNKSLTQSGLPGPLCSPSASKYTLSPKEQAQIDAKNRKRFKTVLYPPQWIQCDLRFFDMSLLGKFSVVMADPPWDIHMELPYGTMSDDEMRKLNIPALQDEGVIFLWVTGRAMELGRECLALWGYERCDEIIWVKTNQLQRIIRTGRTGHWLNHGKEHCLVGVKGNPKDINRGLDCDVIVAEVRATSHKPDEIYGIIERLSPGTRKIELFGRAHNVQPNWITLGNQLNGVRLIEPSLVSAFKKLNLPFQATDHAG